MKKLTPQTATPAVSEKINVSVQQPGTFAYLYSDETYDVYSYIVKLGGVPDGVRRAYINTF